jgi:DNA polymerase III gamma/tau subunit
MKLHWLSLLIIPVVLVGCGQSEPSAPADTNESNAAQPAQPNPGGAEGESQSQSQSQSPGQNPASAPGDYLGAISKAKQTAEKTVSASSISQAIQLFQSQEGRYPQNLKELVTEGYLPQLPQPPRGMQYQYNPQSGEVKVVRE